MDIASVYRRYATEGTGQLALKFADTTHLCKIFIEDGEAVFIKLGTLSPEETLEFIRDKTLVEANFIKGFKTRKQLPAPVTDRLLAAHPDADTDESLSFQPAANTNARFISARTISKLINDYIDVVGPLGVVMMENYIKNLGYARGADMESNDYVELLKRLINDIPQDERNEFLNLHRM